MPEIRKRLVVVGDGNCGKTCMLIVYKNEPFKSEHVPTICNDYVLPVTLDNKSIELMLFDTAGQDEYEHLRRMTYTNIDAVIVVYSIANPDSLQNIMQMWIPEVKHFLPHAPIVLVGNKKDLRTDDETIKLLRNKHQAPVRYSQGEEIAKQIKAHCYLECSAKTNDGVQEVFLSAVRAALLPKSDRRRCSFI